MERDHELKALAAELRAAEKQGAGTAGRPYPVELRSKVVGVWRKYRGGGGTLQHMADTIGVSVVTIWAWAKRDRGELVQVRVASRATTRRVRGRSASKPSPDSTGSDPIPEIRVVGPGGLRVEGMTISGLAELVRRLS